MKGRVSIRPGCPIRRIPPTLGGVGGRGLLLIRTFFDEVRFNPKGNEITLIKRRDPSPGTQPCKS
jgi:hypothetical protein